MSRSGAPNNAWGRGRECGGGGGSVEAEEAVWREGEVWREGGGVPDLSFTQAMFFERE